MSVYPEINLALTTSPANSGNTPTSLACLSPIFANTGNPFYYSPYPTSANKKDSHLLCLLVRIQFSYVRQKTKQKWLE